MGTMVRALKFGSNDPGAGNLTDHSYLSNIKLKNQSTVLGFLIFLYI